MTPEQEKRFDDLVQKTMLFKLENFATKNEDDIKDFISSLLKEERARVLHIINHWKTESDEGSQEVDRLYIAIKDRLTPDTNQTDNSLHRFPNGTVQIEVEE